MQWAINVKGRPMDGECWAETSYLWGVQAEGEGYKQRRGAKLGWGGSAEGATTPVVAFMTQPRKAE